MATLQGMDTYPTKREKEFFIFKMPFLGDMLVSWRVYIMWLARMEITGFFSIVGGPGVNVDSFDFGVSSRMQSWEVKIK